MIHKNAQIDQGASIGANVTIWSKSHVRELASIGANSVIGEDVYIDVGVFVGCNCKVQNGAYLYAPAHLEDGVFVGPNVVLTNDKFPRAVDVDGQLKESSDWIRVGVRVLGGASIGAGTICVAPLVIGKWALIAAGSVVTRDVPNFALVSGNPARFVKWVGRSGFPLEQTSTYFYRCPKTSERYELINGFELVLV